MANITIATPCGLKSVTIPDVPQLPSLSLAGFPPPFPPRIPIPMPDCSFVEHLGSAPEPPEDSEP